MNLAVISFTGAGCVVNERLVRLFREQGVMCTGYVAERFLNLCHDMKYLVPWMNSLGEWTKSQFESRDGIIFVGAAGIAVRAIAPYVKDKMTDPAVVVVDDQGRFSISLLSGHVGGANDLAERVAELLDAVPVITTATDGHGMFAIDVFARERGFLISDREAAKEISADLLDGRPVGFYSDFPVYGKLPEGFTREERCRRAVWITFRNRPGEEWPGKLCVSGSVLSETEHVLRLVPKVLSVGIGCRRGTKESVIEAAVCHVFEEYGLDMQAIACVASVDLKKKEAGLTEFCRKRNLEFTTCGAGELEKVPGEFTESEFVRETTGTGSVCERAAVWDAMKDSDNGTVQLTVKKQALDGVTVAVAVRHMAVTI